MKTKALLLVALVLATVSGCLDKRGGINAPPDGAVDQPMRIIQLSSPCYTARWVVEFSNTFVGSHNEFRYGVEDNEELYKTLRDAVDNRYPVRFWWRGERVYNPCDDFGGQIVYRAEPAQDLKPQPDNSTQE